jgi:hypothetical protein
LEEVAEKCLGAHINAERLQRVFLFRRRQPRNCTIAEKSPCDVGAVTLCN